jgi:hypothetical protein
MSRLWILAERKEEKEKTDKQRNKSTSVAVNNNSLQCNGDGQHNRITASVNFNLNNETINCLPDETWIHELFQGTLVSTTKCLNCETVFDRNIFLSKN